MLSRIACGLIAVAVAMPAQADPMDRYRQLTEVVVHGCSRARAANEITVCGRRAADRWRVPFLAYDAGDPRGETVSGERNRLASAPRPKCGVGAVLAGCGMAGVTISTTGSQPIRLRPLAE